MRRFVKLEVSARARAWLRVALCASCVALLSAVWMVRRASAELSERTLAMGRQLAQLADAAPAGTGLRINGHTLVLGTASTTRSIDQVLDRFEALCAQASGGVASELAERVRGGTKLPAPLEPQRFGVMRASGEGEGSAACMAREGSGGIQGLFEAVRQLSQTGSTSGFGQLRYVIARTSQHDGSTHVVTLSSDGPLELAEMWPESGDAPGTDFPAGVRPPEAVRTLSAEGVGAPYGLTVYESTRAPDEVLASYTRQLRAKEYVEVPFAEPGEPSEQSDDSSGGLPSRVFMRDRDVVILLATPGETGGSVVSATHLQRTGYVAADGARP